MLGTWLRESSWALFASLILHTLGMGLLVGASLAVAVRRLGAVKAIPVTALVRLRPVLGWALALAAFSGVMLVTAYPAKALTSIPLWLAGLTLGRFLAYTHKILLVY